MPGCCKVDELNGVGRVSRSEVDVGKAYIAMIDVVLPELPIILHYLQPNEQHLVFRPSVLSSFLPVLHNIEQTALKILIDHDQDIKGPPAHDEVVQQLLEP